MPMAEPCDCHKVVTKLSEKKRYWRVLLNRRQKHLLTPPLFTSGHVRGPLRLPLLRPAGFRDNRGTSGPQDMGAEPHCLPTMRNAQGPPSVVNTVHSDSRSTHTGPQGLATGQSVVQRWKSEPEPHAEGPEPGGLGSYNHRDACLANQPPSLA